MWRMMKDAARLYEGKEREGSYITKGDATNTGTRPSRGLKKKIRSQEWESGDGESNCT